MTPVPAGQPRSTERTLPTRRYVVHRAGTVRVLGSLTAAILLERIAFWWEWNQRRPFYKFKLPCSHPLYQPGDSWAAELGLSRHQFDSALRQIGVQKRPGTTVAQAMETGRLVIYWRGPDNRVYYTVNLAALQAVQAGARAAGAELYAEPAAEPAFSPSPDEPPAEGVGTDSEETGVPLGAPDRDDAAGPAGEPPTRAPQPAFLTGEPDGGSPIAGKEPEITAEPISETVEQFWQRVQQDLRWRLPARTYEWLIPDLTARLEGDRLVICGPPQPVACLEGHCRHLVEATVQEASRDATRPVRAVAFRPEAGL
jgi:hypothetical protein